MSHDPYGFTKKACAVSCTVKVESWKYPVLVVSTGEIHCDNYEGRWGDISQRNKLKQVYGLEKAKKLARAQGNYKSKVG
jgi:hypothetical protein